jgi:hypothetical protein
MAHFQVHAPYTTAICAIYGGRLEMCHQNSARFYGEIAYDGSMR